jgi:hypothetical protein
MHKAKPKEHIPECNAGFWTGRNLKIKIYRTIILPVVSYRCEAWSLTLREELRLRVFEYMVLKILFGHKRDEVTENGESYIMRS